MSEFFIQNEACTGPLPISRGTVHELLEDLGKYRSYELMRPLSTDEMTERGDGFQIPSHVESIPDALVYSINHILGFKAVKNTSPSLEILTKSLICLNKEMTEHIARSVAEVITGNKAGYAHTVNYINQLPLSADYRLNSVSRCETLSDDGHNVVVRVYLEPQHIQLEIHLNLPVMSALVLPYYVPGHIVDSLEDLDNLWHHIDPEIRDLLTQGDLVTTKPEDQRYRNDDSYLVYNNMLVPWLSDDYLDDYGVLPPEFVTPVGQRPDIYSHWNTHNHYWWPNAELRQYIKAEFKHKQAHDFIIIPSELIASDRPARLYLDSESNIRNGAILTCQEIEDAEVTNDPSLKGYTYADAELYLLGPALMNPVPLLSKSDDFFKMLI